MAISFPRAFPGQMLVAGMSFPPAPMIEITPLRSGRQISKDVGPTLWRPKFSSTQLDPARAGEVRAWHDTLLSVEEFYAYDVMRQYPLAYAGGWGSLLVDGSPFNGTGKIADVESNNREIDLEDLPNGFVLSPGDYLSFDYSTDLRALHRVSAAATANGSGEVTVEVRPHIRPGWEDGAVVSFYRASCRAIILPGTYSEQTEAPDFTTISFEAIQSL